MQMAAHLNWEVVGTHAEPEYPVQSAIADGDIPISQNDLPSGRENHRWYVHSLTPAEGAVLGSRGKDCRCACRSCAKARWSSKELKEPCNWIPIHNGNTHPMLLEARRDLCCPIVCCLDRVPLLFQTTHWHASQPWWSHASVEFPSLSGAID